MSGKKHVVRQGETVQSIADKHGFAWSTLWKHAENAKLKQKRGDPDVLLPGDVLFIPDKKEKKEGGASEAKHTFKRKGTPTYLRLTFLEEDEARKGESYTIEVGAKTFEGVLDGKGQVDLEIPTGATQARVKIGSDEELVLLLGALDPIDQVSGYQARLQNLGYYRGAVDGLTGPLTEEAIQLFQSDQKLDVTGQWDEKTRAKLEQAHGDKD